MIDFVIKRWWPPGKHRSKQKNLYDEILGGRKTSEFRDAKQFWATRLFNAQGMLRYRNRRENTRWHHYEIKDSKCKFRVGMVKLPYLEADILAVYYHEDTEQFEIRFHNVVEHKAPLQEQFCSGCPTRGLTCPCPNGEADWGKCGWKAIYQETGSWKGSK